ncbi:MAG: bifunctional DNA-formamidopyrimidine glycosylase/DNA-(apurinic or apyrimidinic site) lyase [Formosimonas sp.]
MPELPEVEVARMGITPHVQGGCIRQMVVRNGALRWPVAADLPEILRGARISHTARRGKYVLLYCECANQVRGVLLIHLGMSGSLRIVAHDAPVQKHDHIDWVLADCVLRYHDPRRFGSVLWHDLANGDVLRHPRLAGLGVEPLDAGFTGAYFYERSRGKSTALKVALLAGEIVVGVGNIYASEVLFRCQIHPLLPLRALTREDCDDLARHIKEVLHAAIAQGGSTLKDFVNSNGVSGYFQMHYNVYDRTGLPCPRCATPIERMVQAQRATFFCPNCQRLP